MIYVKMLLLGSIPVHEKEKSECNHILMGTAFVSLHSTRKKNKKCFMYINEIIYLYTYIMCDSFYQKKGLMSFLSDSLLFDMHYNSQFEVKPKPK